MFYNTSIERLWTFKNKNGKIIKKEKKICRMQ